AADALADGTQTATVAFARSEIELTGVLDGQDMPSRRRAYRLLAPSGDDPRGRHMRVTQQPTEANLKLFPALRHAAQAARPQLDHAVEKQRPPLSRRRSPNRPRTCCISHPRTRACSNRNHRTAPFGNPSRRQRVDLPHSRQTAFCTYPSAFAGTTACLWR